MSTISTECNFSVMSKKTQPSDGQMRFPISLPRGNADYWIYGRQIGTRTSRLFGICRLPKTLIRHPHSIGESNLLKSRYNKTVNRSDKSSGVRFAHSRQLIARLPQTLSRLMHYETRPICPGFHLSANRCAGGRDSRRWPRGNGIQPAVRG